MTIPRATSSFLVMLVTAGCARQAATEGVYPHGAHLHPFRSARGLWGYFDTAGHIAVEPQYAVASRFTEGLAAVSVKQGPHILWGYIDERGKWVVPPRYTKVGPFADGYASVCVDSDRKFGFIDRSGRVVLEPRYDDIGFFSEGLCEVQLGEDAAIIDRDGRILFRSANQRTNYARHHFGLMRFCSQGRWGFIDTSGSLAIPFEFAHATDFADGFAAVSDGSQWHYIDRTGRFMLSANTILSRCPELGTIHAFGTFAEGMAPVLADTGWGFIDAKGNVRIHPQFCSVAPFSDGVAAVGWPAPSPALGPVEGQSWEDADAAAEREEAQGKPVSWGLVDREGSVLCRFSCDSMKRLPGHLLGILVNGRWQVVEWDGDEVLSTTFTSLTSCGPSLFHAVSEDNESWFNGTATLVFSDPWP